MILYHNRHQKEFVAAIKTNRLVALRAEDKEEGRFVRIDSLTWVGQPSPSLIRFASYTTPRTNLSES